MFVEIQQIPRGGRSHLCLSLSLVNVLLCTSSDRFSYLEVILRPFFTPLEPLSTASGHSSHLGRNVTT